MDRPSRDDFIAIKEKVSELDSHYDILDNRFYSLETVIAQFKRDFDSIRAELTRCCERATVLEVKDENTGSDINAMRSEIKEQVQFIWDGIREGKLNGRADVGRSQLELEKLVQMMVKNAVFQLKVWIYVQTVAMLLIIIGQLVAMVK